MGKKTNGLQWSRTDKIQEDFEYKPQYRTYKDLVEWLIDNDNYSHDMLEEKLKVSGIDIRTVDLSVLENVDAIREVFAVCGELFTCSMAQLTADLKRAQMHCTVIEISKEDVKEALEKATEGVLTDLYNKYNITTGDIDPFQAMALAEHINKIANIYIVLVRMNSNNQVNAI
jgi:hypothetical protein